MNIQVEEIHTTRHAERAQSFHALSQCTTPPHLYMFTSPEALQTDSFLSFYGGFSSQT